MKRLVPLGMGFKVVNSMIRREINIFSPREGQGFEFKPKRELETENHITFKKCLYMIKDLWQQTKGGKVRFREQLLFK